MYWILPPNPPLSCCHFLLCLSLLVLNSTSISLPTYGVTHLTITRKVNEIIRSPPYVDRYFSDHGSVVCSILAKLTATRVRTVTYRKVRSVKLGSCLEGRSQRIFINESYSDSFDVRYGVPQGSCLWPLLFTMYAGKLFEVIETHLPDVLAYADDTQLYLSFNPDWMLFMMFRIVLRRLELG